MKNLRLITILTAVLLSYIDTYAYKLTAYIPQNNPTGICIVVCPGGSYFWLDRVGEGYDVAEWLCENGIAAFVLEYSHGGWGSFVFRIRGKGRIFPAGFNDLRRALTELHDNAELYGIRRDRVGCMGFSAGGHLVMHAAEQLADDSLRMTFVAPIYPVVSMTHTCTHKRSLRGLLGVFPSKTMRDSLSVERHVPDNCPPVFMLSCDDDPVVDCYNSILLDSALTAKNIPHQYEHYATGGHGFGVSPRKTTEEAIRWKERFLEWVRALVADK